MSRHPPLAGLALGLCLLVATAGAAAADDPIRLSITQIDASGYPQVRVIASVTDAQGKPVRGLSAADLRVTQSGAARDARVELSSLVASVELVLALDTSGSMSGEPIADAKRAIVQVIQALGPNDRAAIVTFSATPRVAQGLTADKDALIAGTNAASAAGNTAIYDAIDASADILAQSDPRARRAIVLLTDGEDNSSRVAKAVVLRRVAAAGYRIHVVGLGRSLDRAALQEIADASKGQLLIAPSSNDLGRIYGSLSEQLLTQYSVSFRSNASARAGETVPFELRIVSGTRVLTETSISLQVPAGRGAAPAFTPLPATDEMARASVPNSSRAIFVGLLGAATTLLLLLWLGELLSGAPERKRRRLQQFVGEAAEIGSAQPRRSVFERVIVPFFRDVGGALAFVTPSGFLASTRARLAEAGRPLGLGPVEFVGVRFGSAMVGALVLLAPATFGDSRAPVVLAAGVSGMLLGFALPAFVLASLAHRRKAAIRRALPAALDMLALSVEAGLALDGAIAHVAQQWDTPLSDEFRKLLAEFQLGRDRRRALRDMAESTGLPDVIRFANAVVQADSFGVPLSRVLQEQAVEMRVRRRQRADELARQAPVKMLFPMILLIFPALFVTILGPAIPRLLTLFDMGP